MVYVWNPGTSHEEMNCLSHYSGFRGFEPRIGHAHFRLIQLLPPAADANHLMAYMDTTIGLITTRFSLSRDTLNHTAEMVGVCSGPPHT